MLRTTEYFKRKSEEEGISTMVWITQIEVMIALVIPHKDMWKDVSITKTKT